MSMLVRLFMCMRILFSAFNDIPTRLKDNMERRKEKVVLVMGATGTGKSRLAIDIATRFDGEIINSDKMQVYRGLNVITNKVTEDECRGVPHHLLGIVDPDEDFTAEDFVYHVTVEVEAIIRRRRLPIIAGGSNSYIKALVFDDIEFRSKYECCILWVNVSTPVLHSFVSKRVDQMVASGLVEEARPFFDPGGDYTRGLKRAIGVPELDEYFRNETLVDDERKAKALEEAIDRIKSNTCTLACRQLQNISRLEGLLEWQMHRLDATEAFVSRRPEAEQAWERAVTVPAVVKVAEFLCEDDIDIGFMSPLTSPPPIVQTATPAIILAPANGGGAAVATIN